MCLEMADLPCAKKCKVQKPRFLLSWSREFPWVTYDHAVGMLCKYCIDAKRSNTFTMGYDKLKKDSLLKHARTSDHKSAVEAKSGKKHMEHALAHAYKEHELAVVAALITVYYMAKKNLPNDHFSYMKQFLVIQGCKEIGNLSFQCSSGGRQ